MSPASNFQGRRRRLSLASFPRGSVSCTRGASSAIASSGSKSGGRSSYSTLILAAAAAKIKVEYEDLPPLFDPEEAMAEDAPLVHETDPRGKEAKDNRLRLPWKFEAGDMKEGEKGSAYVAEGEYEAGWVTHCCMGTSGCVATFDPSDNLTIYSNTQIPS